MSDIGAPLVAGSPGSGAAQAAVTPLGEVGLQQLPERLTQLARPVTLSGTVTGQTPDGDTRVRTQAGEVVIRTPTVLPADAPLILQIGPGRPPTSASAFLATVNTGSNVAAAAMASLPLPEGAEAPAVTTSLGTLARSALAAAQAEAAPPLAAAQAEAAPPLAAGTVVPGQVLTAPARGGAAPSLTIVAATTPAETAPLTPGAVLAVRVLGPPLPGPAAPAAAGLQAAPQGGGAPSTQSAPTTPGAAPPSSPTLAPPIRGLVLTGTITGATADGRPILTTPLGSLALTTRTALPPGLRLAVELGAPRDLAPPPPASPPPAAPVAPRPVAALGEALATLEGLEGALAHGLVAAALPQPNRRLAAALTFFLDNAKRGDARGWLGEEAAGALDKAGRHDVMERLSDDFQTTAQRAADAPPGEWRPFVVPFLESGVLQALALHIRAVQYEDESAPGATRGERNHRFILDLDLSRLGSLQLDGLVKTRRFDLILRSAEPLPDPLRHDLLEVFAQSLDAVGFTGGLGFQSGRRGWVKPAPARRGPDVIA